MFVRILNRPLNIFRIFLVIKRFGKMLCLVLAIYLDNFNYKCLRLLKIFCGFSDRVIPVYLLKKSIIAVLPTCINIVFEIFMKIFSGCKVCSIFHLIAQPKTSAYDIILRHLLLIRF